MKKVITIMGLFGFMIVQAQVGINQDAPKATLDIKSEGSTNATKALKITNSANAKMVMVTDDGKVGINLPALYPSAPLDITISDWSGALDANKSIKKDVILIEATPYRAGVTGESKVSISSTFKRGAWGNALGYRGHSIDFGLVSPETTTSPFISFGVGIDENYPSNKDMTRERMRITSKGNVGIGTANPTEKLEVNGAIKVGSNSGTTVAPNHPSEAGTIIFHNNSFYGNTDGTANGWKKLHN